MAEPQVLVVAGLDPSGGAGLIADVRVCAAHGVRPVAVATALTEQTTDALHAVNPVAAEIVGAQLRALVADVEVAAVKLGMLGSGAIAERVGRTLAAVPAPVVWDPVGRATRGVGVFTDDELRAVARQLGAAITVMTPNAAEAAALAGATIGTLDEAVAAGRAIATRYGTVAVLVKGGHWGVDAIDVLATVGACWTFAGPRLPIAVPVHGTGCALSTALACELARGTSLLEAVPRAKAFVAARIAAPVLPGHGRPAVL